MLRLRETMAFAERIEELLEELSPHDRALVLGACLTGAIEAMTPKECALFTASHVAALNACIKAMSKATDPERKH